MRFRPGARLDPGQVQDARGGGGGRGLAVGGGATGIIVVIVLALLGVNVPGGGGGTDPSASAPAMSGTATELTSACRTGTDANQREDCRIVGVVNSVQAYWADHVDGYQRGADALLQRPDRHRLRPGDRRRRPVLLPGDKQRLHRPGFFDELRTRFGAHGGPFAEAYVIAHEYGHHVQDLLGTDERVGNDRQGEKSGSVRLELQADCYAGVWAAHAVDTGFIESLTQADIADGLDAAAAVGDDRIQQQVQRPRRPGDLDARLGRPAPEVVPDRLPQRRRANRCDTFAAGAL